MEAPAEVRERMPVEFTYEDTVNDPNRRPTEGFWRTLTGVAPGGLEVRLERFDCVEWSPSTHDPFEAQIRIDLGLPNEASDSSSLGTPIGEILAGSLLVAMPDWPRLGELVDLLRCVIEEAARRGLLQPTATLEAALAAQAAGYPEGVSGGQG